MGSDGYHAGFSQHIERAAPKSNFRDMVRFEIIRDFGALKALLKDVPYFAFDTETTGLDPTKSRLVGFSVATSLDAGYYIPIAHQQGENAPRKLLRYIAHLIKKSEKRVLVYNKKFDLNILQISEGLDIGDCLNVYDVMGLVWLRDTDIVMPSLKNATEHFLGWQQPKFAETLGVHDTFDLITPDDAMVYAGLDATATFGLFEDTMYSHPYLAKIFKIDNLSIEAIRRIEHPEQRIDVEWLEQEFRDCSRRIQEITEEIFRIAGRQFNPNSRPAVARVLLNLGIVLEDQTDKGAWKVSLDVLEKHDHPLCKLLANYSRESKYLGSYVTSLRENALGEHPVRFSYFAFKAPTGRLACGGEGKNTKKTKRNTYYSPINLQSMPKAKQVERLLAPSSEFVIGWDLLTDKCVLHQDGKKRVFDKKRIASELAKRGLDTTAPMYLVETGPGARGSHGIRSCFIPDDDESCWVSIDYKTQELRIAAALSGEQIWIDAFNNGEDIHMTTAWAVFGKDADSNDRQRAKAINFGGLYGGTEWALSRTMGVSKEEAREYLVKYNAGLPRLATWKSYMQRKCMKTDIATFFGRPRRMARYFRSESSWKQRYFGQRTALNSPVQGCAADVLRIVLGRIYKHQLANPDHSGKYSIRNTVHDEINFSVKESFLTEFASFMPKLMIMRMKKLWGLDLEIDMSIGKNWGECVGYQYQDGKFLPGGELQEIF